MVPVALCSYEIRLLTRLKALDAITTSFCQVVALTSEICAVQNPKALCLLQKARYSRNKTLKGSQR